MRSCARVVIDHVLVGIEPEHPVPRGVAQRLVARLAERAGPLEIHDERAVLGGDLAGAVAGAGVDHHHLVHVASHRGQAAGQQLLLVLDDHAQRHRRRRQAHGALRELLDPRARARERRRELLGDRRDPGSGACALLALPAGAQVQARARVQGLDLLHGLEQPPRERGVAQLVDGDPQCVEQLRFVRRALEAGDQQVHDPVEPRCPGGSFRARQAVRHRSERLRPVAQGRVPAVGIDRAGGDRGQLGDRCGIERTGRLAHQFDVQLPQLLPVPQQLGEPLGGGGGRAHAAGTEAGRGTCGIGAHAGGFGPDRVPLEAPEHAGPRAASSRGSQS